MLPASPLWFQDPRARNPKLAPEQLIKELFCQLEIAHLIFNHIYNGVLVTDAEGYVILFNEPYGRFLGVDPKEQIGKHATEVVENTRMHVVGQTGEAEINHTHRIQGEDMIVQRIPIRKNGKVIAVFGQVMFKNVRDVGNLARKLSLLESKVKQYEEELTSLRSTRYTLDSIQGISPALTGLKKSALKAAKSKLPVLITGESGTGKEVFAQAIHHHSRRRHRPFIRLNCSAIPRDLFESELFGYDRGAFTGALAQGKPGKFELANGGTIFLDEVGDLPLSLQPKLLRVIEEKEFERVGSNRIIKTDFRLIAATNQNLEPMMSEGHFRKDLYYRLNVIPLHLPPIRDRREDILPIADFLLNQMAEQFPAPRPALTEEARRILVGHEWPGNVRELANVLEQALSNMEGDAISDDALPFYLSGRPPASPASSHPRPLKEALALAEKEAIRSALAAARNNKTEAAKILGIHRTLLYKKLAKHQIRL